MLLTIFVPTNTSSYIPDLLKKFSKWKSTSVEMLIAVNGNNKEVVYRDLIKYIPSNKEVNINIVKIESENLIDTINHSITYINGEYVTFIGNDDSFLYAIEDFVLYAKKHSYDAITYPLKMVYFWPSTKNPSSKLSISKRCSFKITSYNPKINLPRLISQVGQDYRDLDLVNFYHGIVKKSLLIKNAKVCGKYVGGFSPDVYFAYTLSNLTEKVMKADYPLTIPGVGIDSASHNSMKKSHQAMLLNSPVRDYKDIKRWNPLIPTFYSVESVWASTLLIAHEDIFKKALVNFNFNRLNLRIYLNNSLFREFFSLKSYLKNVKYNDFIYVFMTLIKSIFRRGYSRLFNRINLHEIRIEKLEEVVNEYFPLTKFELN